MIAHEIAANVIINPHMSVCRVVHFKQLQASPVEGLAVQVWAELHARGHVTGLAPDWTSRVVALVDSKDNPIAFIAFKHYNYKEDVTVTLGGVDVKHRERGCYSVLWNHAVDFIRSEYPEATEINSGFAITNDASRAMHRALKRPVTHNVTTYKL